MKKIILIWILFVTAIFAQQEQKSIELPDFVITGIQNVDVPTAHKSKPELVSTLSKDFFMPQYAPDELPLLISSQPVPAAPSIKNNDFYNGDLKVGVGNYTFPTGNLHLSKAFGNYIVSANAWGTNIKEYEPYSGYNNSGISLNNLVFISTQSSFIPGTQIQLNGRYYRDTYNFFGSPTPALEPERKTSRGNGNFSISNNYMKWINIGADFGFNTFRINDLNLTEKVIKTGAYLDVKINNMLFGGKLIYNRQILDNNISGVDGYNYYNFEGHTRLNFSENIIFNGGVRYSQISNTSFFAPFASVQIPIDKSITVTAAYNPHVNYYTTGDIHNINMYVYNSFMDNVFTKVKASFEGSIKYEYLKYFSISLNGGYSKIDNYMFFDDLYSPGRFMVYTANNVDDFYLGVNAVFHPARFGYFYGEIKYQKIEDGNTNTAIPYEPEFSSQLIYGYDFDFGFGIKISYKFAKNIYSNYFSSNKLNDYNDISVTLSYNLWNNLTFSANFQNIFNKNNFVWRGYKAKPFDAIAGVEYRW